MGHPYWASSALCQLQSRHSTCGRNQKSARGERGETRGSLPSPAWWHSSAREMAWIGLEELAAGERWVTQGRAQREGVQEQSWPGCLPQVLGDDAIGAFPNPGAREMCHETHEYQWGALRERAGDLVENISLGHTEPSSHSPSTGIEGSPCPGGFSCLFIFGFSLVFPTSHLSVPEA